MIPDLSGDKAMSLLEFLLEPENVDKHLEDFTVEELIILLNALNKLICEIDLNQYARLKRDDE